MSNEGWHWTQDNKWHYYKDGLSLCHKWGSLSKDLEQGNNNSPDNCKTCRKKLEKIIKENEK